MLEAGLDGVEYLVEVVAQANVQIGQSALGGDAYGNLDREASCDVFALLGDPLERFNLIVKRLDARDVVVQRGSPWLLVDEKHVTDQPSAFL